MAYILIDMENVGTLSLKGLDEINDRDHLVFFYSENCPSLSQESIDYIKRSKASIQSFKLAVRRPQALDLYIASYVGTLVQTESEVEVAIISKDKGFNSIRDFVNQISSKTRIVIAEDIQSAIMSFSAVEDRERRKRLKYRSQKKSLEEAFLQINNHKERREAVIDKLGDAALADRVDDFFDSVCNLGRKEVYISSIKAFGRNKGTIIYNILRNFLSK